MSNELVDKEEMSLVESGPRREDQSLEAAKVTAQMQAALVIAKKFPRDENKVHDRVIEACKRFSLAEQSMYSYPRGGQQVTGPSIRLTETVLRAFGNATAWVDEVERGEDSSKVNVGAWDFETNFIESKTIMVPHYRDSNEKGKKRLTDERDIYEHVANMGARRKRACEEVIIPRHLMSAAIDQCEKTFNAGPDNKNLPLIDRIRSMLVGFKDLGVTLEMVEARIEHKVDAINQGEFIGLYKVYQSLKDGISTREQWFETGVKKSEDLTEKLKNSGKGIKKENPEKSNDLNGL